jgi:hypothetical protein
VLAHARPLDAELNFELGCGVGRVRPIDFEFRVEQEKPQAIDSHIFARIEFAFERLRYVTFQKLD